MRANRYTLLGYAVWKGGKWYLLRSYPILAQLRRAQRRRAARRVAAVGGGALLLGGAAARLARRGQG